jgi:opacity protein-like surface antigen
MRLLPLLAVLLCLFCDDVFAAREAFEVVVNDPYIELHTGPGRGYPIFHVTERGERIEVLKRRTDWFKVRTPEGKEGWVKRKQMELTLLPTGEGVEFDDPVMKDVLAHRFEFGVQGGDLDGANLISAYLGYALTTNFTAELRGSRGLGDYSNTWLASANLTHTFFPKWRVSPFFSLGTGLVHTEPKSTLVQTEDRTDQTVHAAAGVRAYLTRRFIFRAEYRNYMVLTSRDDNEEVDEWTAGFSVFF